jgi:hypothetical protein
MICFGALKNAVPLFRIHIVLAVPMPMLYLPLKKREEKFGVIGNADFNNVCEKATRKSANVHIVTTEQKSDKKSMSTP